MNPSEGVVGLRWVVGRLFSVLSLESLCVAQRGCLMPGPMKSKSYYEKRDRAFKRLVRRGLKRKGRFGGLPKGYKAPYKGADPRRGTVE